MYALQRFIAALPSAVCEQGKDWGLCCRGSCRRASDVLTFDDLVQWDTFLNVFPAKFFLRHTNIRDLQLRITVRGTGRLRVQGVRSDGGAGTLYEQDFAHPAAQALSCVLPLAKECIYCFLEILPLKNSVTLYDATWGTSTPPLHVPRVALIICTHHRKEALVETLLQIAKAARCSAIFDALVVDNGGDLALDDLRASVGGHSAPWLHLYTNPCNLGGAGGFARGMHEAAQAQKYTHALLMDDDISLHPEMLLRLEQMLRHATQPETLAISGIMLDKDRPATVVEWGAAYPGHPSPIASGRNISLREHLVPPDDTVDYSAWTFFCYPLTPDTAKELPLPLFIRGDDTEFGLRLKTAHGVNITTPPSIAVWHHAFTENSPIALFHTLRNELIINELYEKISYRTFFRYAAVPLYYYVMGKKIAAAISLSALCDFVQGEGRLLSLRYDEGYFDDINDCTKDRGSLCFFKKYIRTCLRLLLHFSLKTQAYRYIRKNSELIWIKYFIKTYKKA